MAGKGCVFGSDNMFTDTRPYFFKLFLEDLNMTEHLRIPPDFKKHILQDLRVNSKAFLRGPSGGIRHVRVVKTDNEIFLEDGWKKFVRENSLGNGDFLLFTYNRNLGFSVQIFDADGMERVSMSDPRKDQLPIAPETGKGPSYFRQPRDLKGSTSSYAQHISSKNNTNRKEMILESFTSNLPHFQVRLKSYHVQKSCSLHIPNAFSRKHLPAEKTMLVLRNEEEMNWEVYSIPYGHEGISYGFYGGWVTFLRDNNLKENDVCIFELVGPREMKVYIVRS